jgi:Tfp pilus assembly protein PilE
VTSRAPFRAQGGSITSVEAFVLAVMTAILVAVAIPSYVTMRDRGSDSAARSELRQAGEAAEAYRAEHGSYAGMTPSALARIDGDLGSSGYSLESLGTAEYCLEATVRGRTWHLIPPERDLLRSGCP